MSARPRSRVSASTDTFGTSLSAVSAPTVSQLEAMPLPRDLMRGIGSLGACAGTFLRRRDDVGEHAK